MKHALIRSLMACALAAPAAHAQVAAPSAWGAASTPWSPAPHGVSKPMAPIAPPPAQRPGPKAAGATSPKATAAASPVRTIRLPPSATVVAGAALQAANRSLLAEAHADAARTGPISAPPDQAARQFGASRSNALLPPGAQKAQACRTPLAISAPRGTLTPGGLIYLRACDLGQTRGELRMMGRFNGGVIRLDVQEWTPTLVIAAVPDGLRGVDDQPVRLQLALRDGKLSNEQSAQFIA